MDVAEPTAIRCAGVDEERASKSVFGERIWTDRRNTQIPEQFTSRVPNLANAYSCIGLAMLVYGMVALDVWMTIAGIVIVHGGKLWYLDRMVLLFEDMKRRNPQCYLVGDTSPRWSSSVHELSVRRVTTRFKWNRQKLTEFPALWAYARDLFQTPGVGDTVDFIKSSSTTTACIAT